MMEMIRNSKEVVERIERSVAYYDCRVKAWQNVKRVYKKDGSDFANFNKNFTGGKVEDHYGSSKFYIHFRDEDGRYMEDWIDAKETPAEQMEAIDDQIRKYSEWKEAAEEELPHAAEIAEFTLNKLREIKEELNKIGYRESGSLYYAICGLIETNAYINRL